MFEAAHLGWRW